MKCVFCGTTLIPKKITREYRLSVNNKVMIEGINCVYCPSCQEHFFSKVELERVKETIERIRKGEVNIDRK